MATISAADGAKQKDLYDVVELKDLQDNFKVVAGYDEETNSLFEDLFGDNATVHYDVFVEKMSYQARWTFDSVELRKRIFAAAEIELRHFKKPKFGKKDTAVSNRWDEKDE